MNVLLYYANAVISFGLVFLGCEIREIGIRCTTNLNKLCVDAERENEAVCADTWSASITHHCLKSLLCDT